VAAAEQQLAERGRQQQQVAAEVSEKQHALQVTRGECAAAQDKLSQVGYCPSSWQIVASSSGKARRSCVTLS
jgi:hypothetical protein